MKRSWMVSLLGGLPAVTSVAAAPGAWTHVAGDPARVAVVDAPASPLDTPVWTCAHTAAQAPIAWVAHAAPVVWSQWVYAVGRIGGQAHLIAVRRVDGQVAWMASVPSPFLDSWSSPVVDEVNERVVMASGSEVRAFEARTGAPAWTCTLQRAVVNASPVVTTDRGGADRLFITHYDGYLLFGGTRLYCINVDPRDGAANPWDPGDIVWSAGWVRASSGNSVAYDGARVYVADAGNFNAGVAGAIRAWNAGATVAPSPLWTVSNPVGEGFYGGLSVATVGGEASVYAASYAFYGGLDSANLVKVDAATGALRWSVACNRSQSIPVPLADGRVVLSTGIPGFGSVPSLQVFRDHGSHAALELDTAADTWVDDGDGVLELGEFLAVGGWTHQPVVVEAPGATWAYAGAAPLSGGFSAYRDLRLVDLEAPASSPAFVMEHHAGAGGSPAVSGSTLYSIGVDGLVAFGPYTPAPMLDVNGDGAIDVRDLHAWEQGTGALDVNGDGMISGADRGALRAGLRAGEGVDMTGGGA